MRCIKDSGKVVCIYSKNSANRPYPELERRIATAIERQNEDVNHSRRRLIYFCIDNTPLPTEALSRLAIRAYRQNVEDACGELWRSITEKSAIPQELDLSRFRERAPWEMDEDEQANVSLLAWKTITNVLGSQRDGSTLAK